MPNTPSPNSPEADNALSKGELYDDSELEGGFDSVVPHDEHPSSAPGEHERYRGDYPIEVTGLRNQFGDQVIHDNLNLRVRRREILGVVGGSGTGKSVLMRSIIGLQQPTAGDVKVFGKSITGPNSNKNIGVRSRWGVLFQGGALFSTLTVGENVEVPLRKFYPNIEDELRHEIARFKVMLSGLPENAVSKFPSELSGGMRKRAGLARALALDPELLFLDEPTAGLDPIGAAQFDVLTAALRDTLGLTVFLITHDLDTLYAICDRIAVLAEKQVIAVGTIPELLATGHPWIEEYFNGPRGRAAQSAQEREEMAAAARARSEKSDRGSDDGSSEGQNKGPQEGPKEGPKEGIDKPPSAPLSGKA